MVDGDCNCTVDRYGLSDTRDDFTFSVNGTKVCVRGWSSSNLISTVVSTMVTKMLELVET